MAKPTIKADLVRNVLKRVDAMLSQPDVPRGWSKTIANEFGLNRQQVQGFKHRFGSADRVPSDLSLTRPSASDPLPSGDGRGSKAKRGEGSSTPTFPNLAGQRVNLTAKGRRALRLIKPAVPEPAVLPNPNPPPDTDAAEILQLKVLIREFRGIIADQAIEIHRLCAERDPAA